VDDLERLPGVRSRASNLDSQTRQDPSRSRNKRWVIVDDKHTQSQAPIVALLLTTGSRANPSSERNLPTEGSGFTSWLGRRIDVAGAIIAATYGPQAPTSPRRTNDL